MRNPILFLFLTFLLVGCAQHKVAPNMPTENLEDITHWEINGKFSVKQPDQVVSANLLWQQFASDRYEIGLRGPLGQGNVQLSGYPDKVIFQDAHGDKETAYNAELLLYHHTGWSMPIESLYYWVRGLPDPHYQYQVVRDEHGNLLHLKQHGWIVDYDSYQQTDDYTVPRRMTLNYTDTRITLLLKTWQINPTH
ncbi:MAG: lipoprotein insertase outer membrane protein LolB [Legionellales bacterium]|jgi:outer membrane lipoprotein LolB